MQIIGLVLLCFVVWFPDYVNGVCWVDEEAPIQMHAIWHLFVVGGSVCHFYAIYYSVLPA